MTIILTTHARIRMQQRGIPETQLCWLDEFGTERYDQSGKSWLYYDHKAKNIMKKVLPREILKKIKFDTYGVFADDSGVFLTVGHRTKRFNRH